MKWVCVNWPASSVWVFIAQLGEHCSANAETTGSNPVEAPKNFFSGYFRNCLNCDSLQWSHTHFSHNIDMGFLTWGFWLPWMPFSYQEIFCRTLFSKFDCHPMKMISSSLSFFLNSCHKQGRGSTVQNFCHEQVQDLTEWTAHPQLIFGLCTPSPLLIIHKCE